MGSNYCGTHITIAIVSDMGSHSVVGVPTHVRDAAGTAILGVVDLVSTIGSVSKCRPSQ